MAKLELINVSKNFGNVEVLRNISFTTDEQDFVVFVGPSGCGKSTLLRVIAGLEDLSDGELVIDGQRVNDLTPKQRGIAMVFQSYALYPHMNVYQNMAFGLGLSRIGREKIDEKVREAAELLELGDLLDRLPKQLSGGQRQRVAIGRAIVRNPKLFLFDEPLSNLDAALRVQMRIEIAKLHARMPATMIYVTHDQVEAMTLASRIIVLSKGRIEQIGTPLEIYRHPANLFVAGFIGSPQMNFLPVQCRQVGGGYMRLELPGGRQIEIAFNEAGENLPNDSDLTLGIRAEHLEIGSSEMVEGDKYHLSGQIEVIEELGDSRLLHIRIQNEKMICFRSSDDDQGGRGADGLSGSNYKVGDGIFLICPGRHCHLFDKSGQALGAISS